MNKEIIPAILSDSLEDVQQKINQVKGIVPRFGIDIIDGLYADNVTIGLDQVGELDWGELSLEVQLMVQNPIDYLAQAHMAKVALVYAQVERMHNREEFLYEAKELALEVGWALDLYTPIDELSSKELLYVNQVLLMGVPAGFSGQAFNSSVLDKIKKLRDRGFTGTIEVDGGMNYETIPQCLSAGANHFAVTSAVWTPQAEQTQANIKQLQELL